MNRYLYIASFILGSICIATIHGSIVYAQGNGLVPIIEDGQGNGVAPATKSKTIFQEAEDASLDLYRILYDVNTTALSITPTPSPFNPINQDLIDEIEPTLSNPQASVALRQALASITPLTYSNEIINSVNTCRQNRAVYETASAQTGIAWEVLAGIHFVEGSCNANQSLVSGRKIGIIEPDVGTNCSSSNSGLGKPIPIGNGCGFTNLLSTAIYAGNHLRNKIGAVTPVTLADFAKALGRYNGTGNKNCSDNPPYNRTPYAHCPRDFEGDDHIYPMTSLDEKHKVMYRVYCADYTQCDPPVQHGRIGALTVAYILMNIQPGR